MNLRLDPRFEKAILSWRYLCRHRQDFEALQRLAKHEAAIRAWSDLARKRLKARRGYEGHHDVVRMIARYVVSARLGRSQRKTKAQIRLAGERASVLARELAALIRENATLRPLPEALQFPDERVAMDRLTRGIAFSMMDFGPKIEAELDRYQVRDFPDFKMSTSEAYRLITYQYGFNPSVFASRLENFAKYAIESMSFSPITPQPSSANADRRALAVAICGTLHYHTGSPCHEITSNLVSVAFDDPGVNAETVKKWWQRRGDSSG